MAGTRRPSSDLDPDLTSSTPQKRSRKLEEGESLEAEDETLDVSLETSEKLLPSDESENSSAEGPSLFLSLKATSPHKPVQSKIIRKETPGKSIGFSHDRMISLDEGKLVGVAKKPVSNDETRHTKPPAVTGPSKENQESIQKQRDSNIGSSSQSHSSEMGRSTGEKVQTSLKGENALYQELSLIGNGAYGTVYKAKDLNSGQVVALKKIRVPLTEEGLPTSTLREIATLKQLEQFEHPNIVKLLDVCQGSYLQLPPNDERSARTDQGLTLWMVFEHVERDLSSYLSSCISTGISPQTVKRMSKEILQGVDFLHSHRITHRDLKPQNLLVTREGRIKIADFGLAKTYDFEMRLTSVVVTLWYRAPEVLLGCPYATPVDIWSVGCILAELSRLHPLFPGTSEGDQLDRIFKVIGTPSCHDWPENVSLSWTAFPYRCANPLIRIIPNLSEQGLDLIKSILSFKPQDRLTAAQALKHPYFSEES